MFRVLNNYNFLASVTVFLVVKYCGFISVSACGAFAKSCEVTGFFRVDTSRVLEIVGRGPGNVRVTQAQGFKLRKKSQN